MTELNEKDLELIGAARRAITANYDGERYMHTVGAAVRTAGGKIYVGINVYSVHGACAEQVALGAAMTAGEREFTDIVAVRGQSLRNGRADAARAAGYNCKSHRFLLIQSAYTRF